MTQINQSCSVAVLDGHDIIYIARAAQQKVMSITLTPGSRLPAYWTSMGRVLLATFPPAQRTDLLDSCDLTPRTPLSKSSVAEIEQSADSTSESSIRIDFEKYLIRCFYVKAFSGSVI